MQYETANRIKVDSGLNVAPKLFAILGYISGMWHLQLMLVLARVHNYIMNSWC